MRLALTRTATRRQGSALAPSGVQAFDPGARFRRFPLGPGVIGGLGDLVADALALTSRSNCAKDSSTLRVSRPIELAVLNCWVTETNDTPWASKISTSRAKSASERGGGATL